MRFWPSVWHRPIVGRLSSLNRPTSKKIRPSDLAIVRSSPGRGRTYKVPAMLRSEYLLADKGYVRPDKSKPLSLACPARSETGNIQQMLSYTNFGYRVKNSSKYLFFMELFISLFFWNARHDMGVFYCVAMYVFIFNSFFFLQIYSFSNARINILCTVTFEYTTLP